MNALVIAVAGLLIIATIVLTVVISVLAAEASQQTQEPEAREAAYTPAHARRPPQVREDTDGTRYTVTLAGDLPPVFTAATPTMGTSTLATLTRVRDRLRDLPDNDLEALIDATREPPEDTHVVHLRKWKESRR